MRRGRRHQGRLTARLAEDSAVHDGGGWGGVTLARNPGFHLGEDGSVRLERPSG
jgi:hypothetical protein